MLAPRCPLSSSQPGSARSRPGLAHAAALPAQAGLRRSRSRGPSPGSRASRHRAAARGLRHLSRPRGSTLARSRAAQDGPGCPEQLPRRPEPYAGKDGVDVSWRAVCVHRRHQDGPPGVRCGGKEKRVGNDGSFPPYRQAGGFPCNRYSQHSSLQHGLERIERTGTTTPTAVTAQATLIRGAQKPAAGGTADPPSSLLPYVSHLSFSTGKV